MTGNKKFLLRTNPVNIGAKNIHTRIVGNTTVYIASINPVAAKLFIPAKDFMDYYMSDLLICMSSLHERMIPAEYLNTTDPVIAQYIMCNPKISDRIKNHLMPVLLTNLRCALEYSRITGKRIVEIEPILMQKPRLFEWYTNSLME